MIDPSFGAITLGFVLLIASYGAYRRDTVPFLLLAFVLCVTAILLVVVGGFIGASELPR
jgi:hypothetical protein